MAKKRGVELPSYTVEGLHETVFKPTYASLPEYLEGFAYTCAVLQDTEALERAAYELAEDCIDEGVVYVEVRFAPQLHIHDGLSFDDIIRAEGERRPLAENSQRDFTMAVILVLDQDENLTAPMVSGFQAVEARFERVWEEDVFDLATLDISTAGIELPAPDPALGTPALVPRSAW